MGLIDIASGNSIWRGIDYYKEKKVVSWQNLANDCYEGTVQGSNGSYYSVHVDKIHPKRSTCNCAFANGRRVICKHMIALYFTAEPKAVEEFLRKVEEYEKEEQQREQERKAARVSYIKSLSKAELQQKLLEALEELEELKDNYWH